MKIIAIDLHYIYVPYIPPVDPYWGWQAPCHGAHAVIVEMKTDEGLVGYGETAGRESVARHQQCADAVVGMNPLNINDNYNQLRSQGHTPIAISGVEMAMWDILGKASGQPLYALLGGRVREKVPLCGLMGVKPPEEAATTAELYFSQWGFRTIKTKAGRDLQEDKEIALSLHSAVGDNVKFRFDANESYSIADAIKLAETYRDVSIEYFEQPVHRDFLSEYASLRREAGIPIALNESVSDARSVLDIVKAKAADALIPDLPDAGGITEICRIAALAKIAELPCAFHCWHDLGVKTAAMAHLVSSLDAFSLASDTTYHGLSEDIITRPFIITDGCIVAPDAPGLGVELNLDVIERFKKKVID